MEEFITDIGRRTRGICGRVKFITARPDKRFIIGHAEILIQARQASKNSLHPMKNYHIYPAVLLALLLSLTCFAANKSTAAKNKVPRTIEWTDLMPEEDLKLLTNMPQVDHAALSAEELAMDIPTTNNPDNSAATSQLENDVASAIEQAMAKPSTTKRTWKDALTSTRVRPEFDKAYIRLAGYIVPLEYDDNQIISAFFLVPYFGACIHVPPPPPNQLIYVSYPKGLELKDLYTPFWLTGTLKVETVENELGLASYSMSVDTMSEYTEE